MITTGEHISSYFKTHPIIFSTPCHFRIPIDPESRLGPVYNRWMNAVAEPTNRKVVAATVQFLDVLEQSSYRSGKTSIEISEDNMEAQLITFPIKSSSPFYQVFSEKIQRLIEAGICPHRLAGRIIFKESNKMFDEEIPALVLSMDDLGVGFYACLIPLALSALVFIVEVICAKVIPTMKEYLAALFAVLTFIRTSHPGI